MLTHRSFLYSSLIQRSRLLCHAILADVLVLIGLLRDGWAGFAA